MAELSALEAGIPVQAVGPANLAVAEPTHRNPLAADAPPGSSTAWIA
jgi:hypothetical protein